LISVGITSGLPPKPSKGKQILMGFIYVYTFFEVFPFYFLKDLRIEGVEYLGKIKTVFDNFKAKYNLLSEYYSALLNFALFPLSVVMKILKFDTSKYSMLITNIGLSPNIVKMNGKELLEINGFLTMSNNDCPLTFLIIGYANNLSIGVGFDELNVSNPQDLLTSVTTAMKEISQIEA
jgi:hypothetical protein